jgi:hypothetical protein
MLKKVKGKIREKVRRLIAAQLDDMLGPALDRQLQLNRQWEAYQAAPAERRASFIESQTRISDLLRRLEECRIPVRREQIDGGAFARWRCEFWQVDKSYHRTDDVGVEKALEHYVAMTWLPIRPGEVVIDMAANVSPFAGLLARRNRNESYMLDLSYPPGIHGDRIGADVRRTGLPDAFADVLTFQCAFECLQGDADARFAAEARRILKPGGRWGIVPLYLDHSHFVKLGPRYDQRKLELDPGEPWVWRDDANLQAAFSRHYSPESFCKRIVAAARGFRVEIVHFSNIDELQAAYPGQRLYCHFLFRAQKESRPGS